MAEAFTLTCCVVAAKMTGWVESIGMLIYRAMVVYSFQALSDHDCTGVIIASPCLYYSSIAGNNAPSVVG